MFRQYTDDKNNATPPVIELASTAGEAYVVGEALVISSGALTKCAATSTPTYLCLEKYTAPATGNRAVRVVRICPTTLYKTTFAADATSNGEGTKVTLHTDGLQVTATDTSGVAEIVKKLSTGASGTEVLVRF